MPFTANDYEKLHQLMNSSPEIRELLQKLLDSQQYTISKISHEVRNPLTLIYSTFQLIESSHPETRDFSHWSELREDIEYTISLLQELSAYNNSEHLHLSTFSAQDFLGQICLSFAASCVDTDIGFSSLIAPDLPSLTADRLKLHEAILNLLRNAREAISSVGSIRLEAVLKDQMLQITISDTGCGISPEAKDHIFDKFYQGDNCHLQTRRHRSWSCHCQPDNHSSRRNSNSYFLLWKRHFFFAFVTNYIIIFIIKNT